MKPTILLTGATGFLGSHLLEALLHQGYSVVVLKRSTSNLWRIEHLIGQFKSYDVDVQPLEKAFEEQKIDCVVHTACQYGRGGDPIYEIVESNLMFGLRVLDACIKFDTKAFINTDTFFNNKSSIQSHLNVYTISKKQFVEWLQQQSDKIQVVNLKLQHVFGPKDDVSKFLPWVVAQFKQNVSDIELTQGAQKRDFIFIDDVVSAFLIVLENIKSFTGFNEFDVGAGVPVTVKFFLEQLKEVYEELFGESITELRFGALPYREGELMSVEVDNHALVDLGWKDQTNIKQGIECMLKERGSDN